MSELKKEEVLKSDNSLKSKWKVRRKLSDMLNVKIQPLFWISRLGLRKQKNLPCGAVLYLRKFLLRCSNTTNLHDIDSGKKSA